MALGNASSSGAPIEAHEAGEADQRHAARLELLRDLRRSKSSRDRERPVIEHQRLDARRRARASSPPASGLFEITTAIRASSARPRWRR